MTDKAIADWEKLRGHDIVRRGQRIYLGKPKIARQMQALWEEVLEEVETESKGDYPGHPFRGNQYTGGRAGESSSGSSNTPDLKDLMDNLGKRVSSLSKINHPRAARAYEVGKRLREMGYESLGQAYRYRESSDVIDEYDKYPDTLDLVAIEAGMLGHEIPYYVTGWRLGEIPKSGHSYNYRDNKPEAGVSVMETNYGQFTKDPLFAAFSSDRPVVFVRGVLNTVSVGADGEPLILNPVEISYDEYLASFGES